VVLHRDGGGPGGVAALAAVTEASNRIEDGGNGVVA